MSPAPHHDSIQRHLSSRVEEGWMPGGCWWVEQRGHVLSGAFGLAALRPDREAADLAVPYDLGSLTKPLATAVLLLLLEQEGLIDLNAPVAEYLPELAGSPYADVTLIDLVAHRAGLPAWRPLYLEASDLAGYVSAIGATPPALTRGRTRYSDLGYILLGAVIERADHGRIDASFDRRIARPLGLERTGYVDASDRFAGAAPTEHGNLYERQMAGPAGDDHPWRTEIIRGEVHDGNAHGLGGAAGHAGLFGTAAEVAVIAREILKPQKLPLSEDRRLRMLTPVPHSDSRTFGMVTARHSVAAQHALPDNAPGHVGFTGTSVWFEPERGRFYILLTNRVHPKVDMRGLDPVRREFHRVAAEIQPRR